jgi:predicted component of viral defense system (DUF524 family)
MKIDEDLLFKDANGNPACRLRIVCIRPNVAIKNSEAAPLSRIDELDAKAYGEESLQLLEGTEYEYEFDDPSLRLATRLGTGSEIIFASSLLGRSHTGRLRTGLHTSRLAFAALNALGEPIAEASVEVRSRKISYREDYRQMLEDIVDRSVDLLLDVRASSSLTMQPDPGHDPITIGQRFAFLSSLIGSTSFKFAVQRIISHPHSRWEEKQVHASVHKGMKPNSKLNRDLSRGGARATLSEQYSAILGFKSLPLRVSIIEAIETDDSPENRFVRFVLQSFASFFSTMSERARTVDEKLVGQISTLRAELDHWLGSAVFRAVSAPTFLPLGSPVLQRKEGYREIYQAWLKFDMAARLVWMQDEDNYHAGKRDIAALYEYWVYFKLLDVFTQIFEFDSPPADQLIEETQDGFGLRLKAGRHIVLEGFTTKFARPLRVQFHYNQTFSANSRHDTRGAWSKPMRPDYTLSVWPADFTAAEAEAQELLVHLHFDAKYRVDHLVELFGPDTRGPNGDEAYYLDAEKLEARSGTFKRGDLLKMHAYRDAIRRTQGAYVIYPGDETKPFKGFSEVLPGIGAFAIRPGNGVGLLKQFLNDVVRHLSDRASTRERQNFHTFEARQSLQTYPARVAIPERPPSSLVRTKPLAETSVLVGWYRDSAHFDWIIRKKLYNFRMDFDRGSLRLAPEVAGAEFLFLHSAPDSKSYLLRIVSSGPRVVSRETMISLEYPSTAIRDHYLIFDVAQADGFAAFEWRYEDLEERRIGDSASEPHTTTLDRLINSASIIRD